MIISKIVIDYNLDMVNLSTHYRLIAIDLSRKKELDADPKAIQQIKFVGQLKNPDNAVAANESIFVLTVLEKIKAMILKFSQGSVTALQLMANYQETRVKLTNTQQQQQQQKYLQQK